MLQNYFTDIEPDESYVGVEPVSLAEAKSHCYITHSEDDDYLNNILIPACRQVTENFCNISLVEKSILAKLLIENNISTKFSEHYSLEHDQENIIELPYGPVKSFESVTQISPNGTITLLEENTDFIISGSLYQSITINGTGSFLLMYTAGYKNAIPYDLKLAILNEIAFRYELRGDKTNRYAAQNVGACEASQALATKYRRLSWV